MLDNCFSSVLAVFYCCFSCARHRFRRILQSFYLIAIPGLSLFYCDFTCQYVLFYNCFGAVVLTFDRRAVVYLKRVFNEFEMISYASQKIHDTDQRGSQ